MTIKEEIDWCHHDPRPVGPTKTMNPFKGKAATAVLDLSDRNGKRTGVQYHNTIIVEFTEHEIKLNATDPNGESWLTPTTKLRMNQVSDLYDLGIHVYQKYGTWWVCNDTDTGYGTMRLPFTDNMIINRKSL